MPSPRGPGVLRPLTGSPVKSPVAILAAKGAQQHRTKYQINHSVTMGTVNVLAPTARAQLRYAHSLRGC